MNKTLYIENTVGLLPSSVIESKLNEYELFIKEYNNSNKYRLIFTISPYCSNVLFNVISEFVLDNEPITDRYPYPESENLTNYLGYTGRNTFNRNDLIQDTGYSHEECGGIQYYCGYDIFDNHILKAKDFVVVNKLKSNNSNSDFNTIKDFVRDCDGNVIQEAKISNVIVSGDTIDEEDKISKHLYTIDSVHTYLMSINENLTEKDGWLGFYNKTNIDINNYENVQLNRVINNRGVGEFIDMYPDRTLYSVIPTYNSETNKIENNWEYCLTYPAEIVRNHALISNGLKCVYNSYDLIRIYNDPDYTILKFRTYLRHNLKVNDKISITLKYTNKSNKDIIYTLPNNVRVVETGDGIYEREHFFGVRKGDITSLLFKIDEESLDGNNSGSVNVSEINSCKIYITKVNNNRKVKYFLRKFKRLKKADGTDYSITVNKAAFSKSIYNDRIGEAIVDDIIDTTGVVDYLGRELSEIYITVFKTNYGHAEWYSNYGPSVINGEDIEKSHCFGPLTAGFDLPNDQRDYNVHCIHNIPSGNTNNISSSPSALHSLSGSMTATTNDNRGIRMSDDSFYGDIIEFDEITLRETVLEDLYFRFNTYQREDTTYEYCRDLRYRDISSDDYDANGFIVEDRSIKTIESDPKDVKSGDYQYEDYRVNLNPEGYYYKAHHKIILKEYNNTVEWGSDEKINFTGVEVKSNNKYSIACDTKAYYLSVTDTLCLLNKNNKRIIFFNPEEVVSSGFTFTSDELAESSSNVLSNYLLFKQNPLKPNNAYSYNDGSGKYNWRTFKGVDEYSNEDALKNRPFANETHYLHRNINLYMRRQDPHGLYGLSFDDKTPLYSMNMIVRGNDKDVSNYNYVKEPERDLC